MVVYINQSKKNILNTALLFGYCFIRNYYRIWSKLTFQHFRVKFIPQPTCVDWNPPPYLRCSVSQFTACFAICMSLTDSILSRAYAVVSTDSASALPSNLPLPPLEFQKHFAV